MKFLNKIIEFSKTRLNNNIHLKELYTGTLHALWLRIAGYVVGYLFIYIVAKIYGPGATGTFVLTMLLINVATIFSTLGNENTILVIFSKNNSKGGSEYLSNAYVKLLLLTVLISVLLSASVYFLSGIIAIKIFNKPALILPVKILAFAILPLSIIKLNAQLLRGLKKIKEYVFYNNIAAYLIGLIILAGSLIVGKNDSDIYFSLLIASYLTLALSSIPVIKIIKKFIYSTGAETARLNDLLKISFPLFGTNLLNYLKLWIGVFIAGIFLPKSVVGVYGISIKMITVFSIIIFSVGTISMPKIGNLYKNVYKDDLKKFVGYTARISSYIGIPLILLSIIFAGPIFSSLGGSFKTGFTIYIILCCGQIIETIFSPANFILQMIGRQKVYFLISAFATAVQLAACIGLISIWGINGAALAYSAGVTVHVLMLSVYIKKNLNINAYYFPGFFSRF